MYWIDVAGPPGVGKSTLCDPLWGPHEIDLGGGSTPPPAGPPRAWHDFTNEVTRLLALVQDHPTFVAAVRMNRRSMRKMAAVAALPAGARADKPPAYIQTGFVQRGLGFGWRLEDMGLPVEELFHFFRLMPVSLGVAFLEADSDVVKSRNRAREQVAVTAHENRSHMVDLMAPAIGFARATLKARGVPTLVIPTTGPVDGARVKLREFAARRPCGAAPAGCTQDDPFVHPPLWW